MRLGGYDRAVDYLNPQPLMSSTDRRLARWWIVLYYGTARWFGPEVLRSTHDGGRKFIDSRRLQCARLWFTGSTVVQRCSGTRRVSLLNLPFLLKTTVQDTKPPIGTRSWNDKRTAAQSGRPVSRAKSHCVDYKGAFNTLKNSPTACTPLFITRLPDPS
jgi:hypothetical protein